MATDNEKAALLSAVELGQLEEVESKLRQPGAEADFVLGDKTLLMLAAFSGFLPMVELLLSFDPDLNLRNSQGSSALDMALFDGNQPVIDVLLAHKGPSSTAELQFTPSRVEGLEGVDDVRRVLVTRTGLTLYTSGLEVLCPFESFPERPWLSRIRQTLRVRFFRAAERDGGHRTQDRFIRFLGNIPITVYMPDGPDETYSTLVYTSVRSIIALSGFESYDLG